MAVPTQRYVRTMTRHNINRDTNIDTLSCEALAAEARTSKKNVRVKLLQHLHNEIEEHNSMETAYGYNPENDMSFTGEFEAIS